VTRRSAFIVCDQDIRAIVQDLQKSSPGVFDWVQLVPGEWHVSLCVRLTIGATWSEPFLVKMIKKVEGKSRWVPGGFTAFRRGLVTPG